MSSRWLIRPSLALALATLAPAARADVKCHPVVDAGGPYQVECSTPLQVPLEGTHIVCKNDPVDLTWTTDCPGASFSDPKIDTPILTLQGPPPCPLVCTVTLTGKDPFGGEDGDTTTLTVSDTTPPVLDGVVADVTVECDAVPAAAVAKDACDPSPAVVFSETRTDGACPGRYTLKRTWLATDACGNATAATQVITVEDTTPPAIQPADGDLYCLWPPDHEYACFSKADFAPQVVDACGGVVTWLFAGCASDQPDGGPTHGSGNTALDCVVSADGAGLCVRSERAGGGAGAPDGRHYSVSVIATDACGNASAPVVIGRIRVPHDAPPRGAGCLGPR